MSARIQKATAIPVGRAACAHEPLTGPQLLARVRDHLARTAALTCTDLGTFRTWLTRDLTAGSADEVFTEGTPGGQGLATTLGT
ncbi:hypothetical protein [Streptomyces sp. 11x1]|uniref:hypothetical protein n=1 Tax=Streptomyces sp. 11x1 TaxID=3038642 RepID=UPI00292F85A2|nr:hypothetical protein [Streptomyces sp. 11x1]WNZ10051.1 hypothetical protein P8T65_22260 [Streptomyces sp. 11x1]